MGKRKKSGSTPRPSVANLPDAVSDQEDGDASNLHLDEVDAFYADEDNRLSLQLQGRSKKYDKIDDVNEVFGMSDSDDDFIDSHEKKKKKKMREKMEQLGEDEFDVEETTGFWGDKKRNFYGGNPNEKPKHKKSKKDNDENELDEAEVEEKESRFLQEKQLQNLTDEDFLFDAFSSTSKKSKKSEKSKKVEDDKDLDNIKLDLSKLSRKEKVRLFERESPEFASIVEDFEMKMKNAREILQPIIDLINDGVLPNDGPAAQYIKLKYKITINYCINIASYLMFKSKRADLRLHPLTARLVYFKKLLDEIESQLDPLVQSQVDQILSLGSSDSGIAKIEKLVSKSKRGVIKVKKEKVKKPKKTLQLLKKTSKENGVAPQLSTLTPDEAMAIELYGAIKKKKTDQQSDEESEQEDENDQPIADNSVTEEQRRSITYEMSKNKGLIPKRSKLQRNPRVKHRKKYEKAKIRRKGQIREVRKEVKKYDGEHSGINKRVKKGIKLA